MLVWIKFSAGYSLIATFVPGIIFAWLLLGWLYFKQINLPSFEPFSFWYFCSLAIQFLHFGEEFTYDFINLFPALYGGNSYPQNLFVFFNMGAYFVFMISFLLVYYYRLNRFLLPVLFFVVYGVLGNVIAHTTWSINLGKYFPGLITAQFYWILAPILLFYLLRSIKHTIVFILLFIVSLVFCLHFFHV